MQTKATYEPCLPNKSKIVELQADSMPVATLANVSVGFEAEMISFLFLESESANSTKRISPME